MTFCIITHVPHTYSNGRYFAYAPYVNEMNIWLKYVEKVIIVAPLKKSERSAIHQKYIHPNIIFIAVPSFSLLGFRAVLKTLYHLPFLLFSIFKAMKRSHHIHLRCPGNMGLLGSFVQILFPKKTKTAKYAGNWDSNSKQPFTYNLQKNILSNTFLTRNMDVLVYGDWKNQSKNIKPFFTATYSENEKLKVAAKSLNEVIQFIFVGSLTSGKQAIVALKIVEELRNKNYNVNLSIYGEGVERQNLGNYISSNNLSEFVALKGNCHREQMKTIYQNSHFLLLPSKSEGWPKVVAEAMFWGCLPIVTSVSCVPEMLDYGNRGLLISDDFDVTVSEICNLLNQQNVYDSKINAAINWSRRYTIDTFEVEIKKLLVV